MKMYRITLLHLFPLFFAACGGGASKASLFDLRVGNGATEFSQNQKVAIELVNKKAKTLESVTYYIDDETLKVENGQAVLDMPVLGSKTLKAVVSFENDTAVVSKKIRLLADNPPVLYTYEIINTYPHDMTAYTQGLEFHNDTLYESTGLRGRSTLRKVDFKSGEILKKIDLSPAVFGEGLTILNGKLYQLTWQSGMGYIYHLDDFEQIGTFNYGESEQGWGLANDGSRIFKSDGTEKIWILDPETLAETGHIETVTDKSIFNKANELEYLDGKLYANVYQKESMMIIDATSGAIEGVINFGGLKEKVMPHKALDVLNGVAYHPGRHTFFVTGKNWDKLFEVKIMKKTP